MNRKLSYKQHEKILHDALAIRDHSGKMQAKIFLVGCYANKSETHRPLKIYWKCMRDLMMKDFTCGDLHLFDHIYYLATCNIYAEFGYHAWDNTLPA